jgi:hypothetical protein
MTKQTKVQKSVVARAVRGLWLCGLLLLSLAYTASAASDTYQNDSVVDVTIPPQSMPTIDATNFVNNNSFTITFTAPAQGANTETFESEDTLNYTNNGLMVANSSYLTNVYGFPLNVSPGCGFLFDHYSTSTHQQTMSRSFNNAGTIRANSLVDILANATFGGTVGKCTVSASNIVNSGTMQLGFNSLIQLTGQDIDLTRGILGIEGFSTILGVDSGVGTDTNQDWHPSIDLTSSTAAGSEPVTFPPSSFPPAFQALSRMTPLTNSTPYFLLTPGVSNVVVRAIFIQNQLTNNVSAKIYWANAPFVPNSGGFFNIEWDGTYYDPSTGLLTTNFLYLNASADFSAPFLPFVNAGIPNNFTFFPFNQELFFTPPATPGFPAGVFQPFGAIATNDYSYVNAQFIDSTVATNASVINPSGALTNLPGRIQIIANHSMDMSLAQIAGLNYMSLASTNQFNGAAGAQISSPFSDINLGVTNGFLSISNVLEPVLVDWKGNVQAWASHWIYVDPTGFTNDYRVILINSTLSPTTPAEIQNLRLHGTNLVISDALNSFGTVSIDAQNLTLTTNVDTPGAPDGELTIRNPTIAWSTALPNLRNITNSGLINVANANPVNFGTAVSPYGAFINHGRVFDQGATVYAANFESDGFISNNVLGSFTLQSQTATFTNGILYAGGDVSIASGSLLTSNLLIRASRSLTLNVTNQLTDTGPTNGSIWIVGTNSNGGVASGFNLLHLAPSGDLLGTTVTNYSPVSKNVVNVWAGTNYGVSAQGYTNNQAIGRLILDALPGPNNPLNFNQNGVFTFKGVGASNAIYVDYLELRDAATNRDGSGQSGTNFVSLSFNTNLVIYYSQAVINGLSVAKKIDHWNSGHLRWVPQYAGYFGGYTNVVVVLTNVFNGTTNVVTLTNAVNAALAQSGNVDTNGIFYNLPVPFTTKTMAMTGTPYTTNNPPNTTIISWLTYPLMTNTVEYSTDLVNWQYLTNVSYYSTNLLARSGWTNFMSIFPYTTQSANTMCVKVGRPTNTPAYYRVFMYPILTH